VRREYTASYGCWGLRSLSLLLPSTWGGGRPSSQGWKTFLRNHAAGIASIDLLVVRTISFKLLYGLVTTMLERDACSKFGLARHSP